VVTLGKLPSCQRDDAIRDGIRFSPIVGDPQGGDARGAKDHRDLFGEAVVELAVEPGQGLVEE
jgi:hypothetical protein